MPSTDRLRVRLPSFVADQRYAGIAALCALALILRLPGLTESLWFDEARFTRVHLASVGDLLRFVFVDPHPPLWPAIGLVWTSVFGDSELSVRALPMLAGLLSIALMPTLGSVLATRNAGWLAGVLMAMSPVHIWYSQEARPYSLLVLLAILLVLQWHRIGEAPPTKARQVSFVATSIVLSQLHLFALALPGALVVMAVWQRRNQKLALLALGTSVLGVAAVLGIKTAAGVLRLQSDHLGVFDPQRALFLFGNWFPLGGSVSLTSAETSLARIAAWSFLAIASTSLLVWLASGWRNQRLDRWLEHLLMLLALPAGLLGLAILGRTEYYIERSALTSLPYYFLAIATAIWMIRNDAVRRLAITATVLSSALILGHYYARRDRYTVYKPNPDWRSIVSPLLEARGTPPRPLVIFSTEPVLELKYYVPSAEECEWPPPPEPGPRAPSLRSRLAGMFPRSKRLTCGANGAATVRTYVSNFGPAWIDEIRAYENDAKPLVLLNLFWPGTTPELLQSLRAEGRPLRLVARSLGIEVYAID